MQDFFIIFVEQMTGKAVHGKSFLHKQIALGVNFSWTKILQSSGYAKSISQHF